MYRIEYGSSVVIVNSWNEVETNVYFNSPLFRVYERTSFGWCEI